MRLQFRVHESLNLDDESTQQDLRVFAEHAQRHGHTVLPKGWMRARFFEHPEFVLKASTASSVVDATGMERVLTIADATEMVTNIALKVPVLKPPLRMMAGFSIALGSDSIEPISNGRVADAYPGHELWLRKCRRRRRWMVAHDLAGEMVSWIHPGAVAGSAIIKPSSKGLKLCGLDVSPSRRGCGIGKSLIETVEDIARLNRFDEVFATAFENRADVVRFLIAHGFETLPTKTRLGELVFTKAVDLSLPLPVTDTKIQRSSGLRFTRGL